MSLELTCFEFEPGTELRGGVTPEGVEYIIASDVCKVANIINTSNALTRLDEDEKGLVSIYTLGGTQTLAYVTESGFYNLVLGARFRKNSPNGERLRRFKKWVTGEVLPTIRKTGRYDVNPVRDNFPSVPTLSDGASLDVLSDYARMMLLSLEHTKQIRSDLDQVKARQAETDAKIEEASARVEKVESVTQDVAAQSQEVWDSFKGKKGFYKVSDYCRLRKYPYQCVSKDRTCVHQEFGRAAASWCRKKGVKPFMVGGINYEIGSYPQSILDELYDGFPELERQALRAKGIKPLPPKQRQEPKLFGMGEDDYPFYIGPSV